jgi:hypothetical protein
MYLPSVGQDLSQLSVDILEKSKLDAENADRSKDVVDAVPPFDGDIQVKIIGTKINFLKKLIFLLFHSSA